MKRYEVKDKNGMFVAPAPEPEAAFDVLDELAKTQLVLQREIRNLLTASARGKLSPTEARDLVSYVKLLSELKRDIEADLASKSDEELIPSKS